MIAKVKLESIRRNLTPHPVVLQKKSAEAVKPIAYLSRASCCPCDGSCPNCSPQFTDPRPPAGYRQCETEADQAARAIAANQPIPIHMQAPRSALVMPGFNQDGNDRQHADRMETTQTPEAFKPAGAGNPLPKDTRDFFEEKFQHSLAHVRIHDNSQAAFLAKQQQADAYTIGQHIVFDQNQYAPHTTGGRRLLAHEIAHVIQQGGSARSSRLIQRQYTVKAASQIVKQVNPQPSPPKVTFSRVIPALLGIPLFIISQIFNYPKLDAQLLKTLQIDQLVLGPFRAWLGKKTVIMDNRNQQEIKQPRRHLNNLVKVEEPFQRKTVIRHQRFINKVLKVKPQSTWQDLSRYVFGFSKAPQKNIGAETRMFLSGSGRYAWMDWATIGEITPRPLKNPFYEWAALLHEGHHSATAKNAFTNQAAKEVMDLKNMVLNRPNQQFQPSDPVKINDMKSKLRLIQDPAKVFVFIKSHPLLALDTRMLGGKIQSLYQKWENFFSQTINYAKEELAAYCISWQAIRNAISFIKQALAGPKRRGQKQRP